jgi:hypothetical protein
LQPTEIKLGTSGNSTSVVDLSKSESGGNIAVEYPECNGRDYILTYPYPGGKGIGAPGGDPGTGGDGGSGGDGGLDGGASGCNLAFFGATGQSGSNGAAGTQQGAAGADGSDSTVTGAVIWFPRDCNSCEPTGCAQFSTVLLH